MFTRPKDRLVKHAGTENHDDKSRQKNNVAVPYWCWRSLKYGGPWLDKGPPPEGFPVIRQTFLVCAYMGHMWRCDYLDSKERKILRDNPRSPKFNLAHVSMSNNILVA